MIHKPVLVKEVLEYLLPKPHENFIDGTVGQAGHTVLLLEKNGPDGKVLGIDLDATQIENAKATTKDYGQRVILVNGSYVNMKSIATAQNFAPADGILLDVGYSSWQLEDAEKGFSFQKDEMLDMRYSENTQLTAKQIVNEYSQEDIEKILEEYGEERFARKIAREIVIKRKEKEIETTFELVEVIKKAVPQKFHHGKIHCATKVFQALRIAVNDELESLKKVLPDALSLLVPGGRLVVISFHSLEDRIVKNFFNEKLKEQQVKILTKKPVTARQDEVFKNPRSRSAKLRALYKI